MLHFTCSRIVHRIVPWSLSQADAKFRIYDIWKLPPKGKMCVIHSGDFSWLTSAGLKVSSPILSLGINLVEASKMGMNFYWRCIKNLNRGGCMKWFIKNDCRFFFTVFTLFLVFGWRAKEIQWLGWFRTHLKRFFFSVETSFNRAPFEVWWGSHFFGVFLNCIECLSASFLLKNLKARVTFLNWLLFELNSMALMELMNQSR